jgi:hypothetical protein
MSKVLGVHKDIVDLNTSIQETSSAIHCGAKIVLDTENNSDYLEIKTNCLKYRYVFWITLSFTGTQRKPNKNMEQHAKLDLIENLPSRNAPRIYIHSPEYSQRVTPAKRAYIVNIGLASFYEINLIIPQISQQISQQISVKCRI